MPRMATKYTPGKPYERAISRVRSRSRFAPPSFLVRCSIPAGPQIATTGLPSIRWYWTSSKQFVHQ